MNVKVSFIKMKKKIKLKTNKKKYNQRATKIEKNNNNSFLVSYFKTCFFFYFIFNFQFYYFLNFFNNIMKIFLIEAVFLASNLSF